MSYLEHFGLSSEPFSNAPVSRFYYNAPQHQQALARLLYAVNSMKGLAVLVGEIGAGKTTLARRMLDSLPEEEYEAALLVIIHSGITASWLLRRIALQIGVENPAQEKLALLSQLYQRLLQIYEQGRKAVVLIDEAQMLETRELMEEFRGLLNLEVPERKLISFVFFGLPEIEKNLKLDPPLAQRVAMRYRLEPFTSDSTEAYIKHRLRLAGSARNPFTGDAIEAVHRRAGGTPRVINTICDNALFETFLARGTEIRGALIEQIADNLGLETGVLTPAVVPSVAAPEPVAPPAIAPPPPVAPAKPAPSSAPPPRPSAVPAAAITAPSAVFAVANAPPPIARPPQPPAPASAPVAATVRAPVPPVARPPLEVPPVIPNVVPRDASMAAAVAGLTGDPVAPPAPVGPNAGGAAASKPRAGVDLAEIDRYLEGLGKL
ncbi:MAG: AAA family ATPase [Archangium sp.]|nr:AAA family ATPase [Archangium sp.]MDP3156172.1 AAA family ATPase [Archangium sp.]MDP3571509.1 AAA family ATPase [Archangium sp.]